MTKYNPSIHKRRSIRLRGYDYTQAGAYFVTIVTYQRELIFDDPVYRRVAETMWQRIPRHFAAVQLDQWVVMPNHIHGILWIIEAVHSGKGRAPVKSKLLRKVYQIQEPHENDMPPKGTPPGSLGAIVGNFKSVTTRRINKIRKTPGVTVWHRNYYDRIIRDENELSRIRQYILDNPTHWDTDRLYGRGIPGEGL